MALHHHHRGRPSRGRHADGGEQAERQIEVPGARDEAVRPERHRQQGVAGQDELARAEAISQRAQDRARAAAHEREDGEGAREHGAAPAELLQEGDEEDAGGVPDPVGQG